MSTACAASVRIPKLRTSGYTPALDYPCWHSLRAEDLVAAAADALANNDYDKANAVIEGDRELDALELELDEHCINLLALHQPFARDLRLITMAMRIVDDLERLGDHAVNVAEYVLELKDLPSAEPVRELNEMAEIAKNMLADALDSFVRSDTDLARKVWFRDDEVDRLHDLVIDLMQNRMKASSENIDSSLAVILSAKDLERVADLATNIAKDVIYLVEGRAVKHSRR